MFLSCALQIGKNTVMIQEYPIAIDHITAVLILNNLQYSTEVVKFGILSQYRSLVWLAFSLLKETWLIFEWIERIGQAAYPHPHAQLNCKHIDNRGGHPCMSGGFLKVSSPYHTVKPV